MRLRAAAWFLPLLFIVWSVYFVHRYTKTPSSPPLPPSPPPPSPPLPPTLIHSETKSGLTVTVHITDVSREDCGLLLFTGGMVVYRTNLGTSTAHTFSITEEAEVIGKTKYYSIRINCMTAGQDWNSQDDSFSSQNARDYFFSEWFPPSPPPLPPPPRPPGEVDSR
jgi:hypothetical protein